MQVQAQTQVIESIAKMMESIAGLSRKESKRRRRRVRSSQPITVQFNAGNTEAVSRGADNSAARVVVETDGGSAPVSKAAMMDLILTKLQNLDKFEKEIAEEMMSKQYVTTADSSRPVASAAPEVNGFTVSAAAAAAAKGPSGGASDPAAAAAPAAPAPVRQQEAPVLDMMSMLPQPSPQKLPSSRADADAAPVVQGKPSATLPDNVSILDPNIKAVGSKKQTVTTPSLSKIQYDKDKKHEFRKYIKDLENTRAMQDVPFKANGLTMVEAVELFSDSLYDTFLESVGREVSNTLDSYAEELFNTI
jgi:hypothetical protein